MVLQVEINDEAELDSLGGDHVGLSAQWRRLGVLGLAAFALVTCFVGLNDGPALGDHECINALAARQTLESGNWLIPHLGEIPRIRKPPLGIWLIAAASYVVDGPTTSPPVTDYSARLPSALAAWGTVLLVYWLGRQMYGYRAGLTAGFVAASCVGIIFFAHSAQVDMVLAFFTTLSFACFWRGAVHPKPSRWAMVAFYVAFALAMMAKAPLPLVTVGLALAVYWFVTVPLLTLSEESQSGATPRLRVMCGSVWSQFGRLPELWVIPGIILFLLVAGAWPAYVHTRIDQALALWRVEYLDRFTGEMSDRRHPVLYYVPILLGLAAPFMLSLPEAVAAPFLARHRAQRKGLGFVFTWAIVGTCFLSASAYKRPHYVLSLVPAYCLLLGPVIDRLFFGGIATAKRGVQMLCRLIPVLLALVAIAGGVVLSREYPNLLRSYMLGVTLALIVWTAACYAFARGHGIVSFAELNLGVVVLLMAIWPGMREGIRMNAEGDALAQALEAHNVQLNDLIFWVDGRPDASVEFYSGYHIRRLINEMEITEFRTSRGTQSVSLYREYARRIRQRFSAPEPTYLIMSLGSFRMLDRNTDIGHRLLFQLEGFHPESRDDWVVITQPVGPRPPRADGPAACTQTCVVMDRMSARVAISTGEGQAMRVGLVRWTKNGATKPKMAGL